MFYRCWGFDQIYGVGILGKMMTLLDIEEGFYLRPNAV